jgi:hypothetical protein
MELTKQETWKLDKSIGIKAMMTAVFDLKQQGQRIESGRYIHGATPAKNEIT